MVRFTLRPIVSKISHILSFPIDYHVKRPQKNKNNLPKIQNLKFHNSLSNFGRDPPQEHAFFGNESGAYFQRRCLLKYLLPCIWSYMLTKTKKKLKKFGDMVDRYLSVKFGVNSHEGFRENDVYGWTKNGRTTYAHVMTVLCCAVAQSRVKKTSIPQ